MAEEQRSIRGAIGATMNLPADWDVNLPNNSTQLGECCTFLTHRKRRRVDLDLSGIEAHGGSLQKVVRNNHLRIRSVFPFDVFFLR